MGGGSAEAEEDGVARLAGDEGAVGVEQGAVEEAGDHAANKEDVGCMGSGDSRCEEGGEAGAGGVLGRGGDVSDEGRFFGSEDGGGCGIGLRGVEVGGGHCC